MMSSTSALLRLAVQRLMSCFIAILMVCFLHYDLSRFLLGHYKIAAQALASFKALYAIEAEAKDLTAKEREQRRQEKARPILEKLHDWMLAQRTLVRDGSGTAKALDYSLKRWAALTRYLEDGCKHPVKASFQLRQNKPS